MYPRTARTHVRGLDACQCTFEEVATDLVEQRIVPRGIAGWLAAAHAIEMALAIARCNEQAERNRFFLLRARSRYSDSGSAENGAQESSVPQWYRIGEKQRMSRKPGARVVAVGIGERAIRKLIARCHGLINVDWIHAVNCRGHAGCELSQFFETERGSCVVEQQVFVPDVTASGNTHSHQIEKQNCRKARHARQTVSRQFDYRIPACRYLMALAFKKVGAVACSRRGSIDGKRIEAAFLIAITFKARAECVAFERCRFPADARRGRRSTRLRSRWASPSMG